MDCQMPEMDGYEATAAIRAGEASVLNRHIPIVAMTANVLESDRDKALQAGMDGYITKPFEARVLADTIQHWLDVRDRSAPALAVPETTSSLPD